MDELDERRIKNPCFTCGHAQNVHHGSYATHCVEPLPADITTYKPGIDVRSCYCTAYVPVTADQQPGPQPGADPNAFDSNLYSAPPDAPPARSAVRGRK